MDEATHEAMDRCLRRFAQGWSVSASRTTWVKSSWWTESEDMTASEQALMASYFGRSADA